MQDTRVKLLCLIVTGLICAPMILFSPTVTHYVEHVKASAGVPAAKTFTRADDDLEIRVKEAAERYSEPPVNARIDSVWKAIPAYNGLVVDESRTLALARERGAEKPLKLVFREIPPDIQLEDLPPHPIYRGNERKPMVGLMVNVAWGTEHVRSLLHVLEREGVRATFFLDGSWLAKHADVAREIVKNGHEIGNHAYHHPQMSRLTKAQMRREIEQTEQLIEETLQVTSKYFAPPSGDFNDQVVQTAAELGMKTVLWTADTVDWRKTTSPQAMVKRVAPKIENGTLVLMHPTDRTVKALPEIIRIIKERELWPGTVDEVLSPARIPRVEALPHI